MPTAAKHTAEDVTPEDVTPDTTAEDVTAEDVPEPWRVDYDGHQYTVAADTFDDLELLDDIGQFQDYGDATRIPTILRRILGPAQYRTALGWLRQPATGRVRAQDGVALFGALMEGINPSS